MSRPPEARKRQLRYLIRSAQSVVTQIPETRMVALGAPYGTDAETTRAAWMADAVKRPRDVLIALAKEPRTPRA